MNSKQYPFVVLGYGNPPRPLVPFDFPKGKNVLCLIDSGASASFILDSFFRHEEVELNKSSRPDYAVGICGKSECLEILGAVDLPVSIGGWSKEVKLTFNVVPDRYKLDQPIIGIDLFKHFKVGFGEEKGGLYTLIQQD